jgi:putative photosynthetic complex assembly protein
MTRAPGTHHAEADPVVPRGLLVGAALLLAFTIGCALLGHLTGAAKPLPTGTAVEARALRFLPRDGGGLLIADARTGATVRAVRPDEDGFLRTIMQELDGLRARVGADAAIPFRLTTWRDGRLTLDDPVTGTRLDLEAFGPTNEAAFARLMQGGGR